MKKVFTFKRDKCGDWQCVRVGAFLCNELLRGYYALGRSRRIWITVSTKPVRGWDVWYIRANGHIRADSQSVEHSLVSERAWMRELGLRPRYDLSSNGLVWPLWVKVEREVPA